MASAESLMERMSSSLASFKSSISDYQEELGGKLSPTAIKMIVIADVVIVAIASIAAVYFFVLSPTGKGTTNENQPNTGM